MAAAKKIIKKSIVKSGTRKAHRVGKNSKALVTTVDVHNARNALAAFEKNLNCDRSIARALYAVAESRKEFTAMCEEYELDVTNARHLVRLWVESRDLHLQYREDLKLRAKSK